MRTIGKKFQEKFESFQLRFVGGVAFEIFTPIGSHVNKNEKKFVKNLKTCFFLNQKTCQRMAQGKPQPKFERNPCILFRDNCDTDDGLTKDKSPIPWALLTESSRAKRSNGFLHIDNRKSYMGSPTAPLDSTLSDLERSNSRSPRFWRNSRSPRCWSLISCKWA